MPFKMHPRHLMIMGCSFQLCCAYAATPEEEFLFQGVSLFGEQNKQLDITQFQDHNHIEAGQYLWNVTVNQTEKEQQLFELKIHPHTHKAELCLSPKQLTQLGIQTAQLVLPESTTCLFAADISPYFSYEILQQELKVKLTVPNVLLIDPVQVQEMNQQFQHGANSFFSNYAYNYSRAEQTVQDVINEQHFLGLQTGLNLQGWYLRHQSVLSVQDNIRDYQSGEYTLYRDLPAQRARMSLGHVGIAGQNSVPLFGLMLESDPMMRPVSERHYTAVIENIAQSHALVKVYQNNRLVFEKTVTPGPFRIDELRGLNRQGDLSVEIHEANQQIRHFTVPYVMQLNLLRHKQLNYHIVAGDYVYQSKRTGQQVLQGDFEYGLNQQMTMSGGLNYAEDYIGGNWGAIYNHHIGGFALQMDYAHSSRLAEQGYKLQLNYQTQQAAWGSSLSISATQHSLHFPVLFNALQADQENTQDRQSSQSMKQDWRLSLNQRFSQGRGSLAMSAIWSNYWQSSNQYSQLQLSYANAWRKLQYSLSYSHAQSTHQLADRNLFLTLSLPLGTAKVSVNMQQQNYTRESTKSSLNYSSAFGQNRQWSYTLNGGYLQQENDASSNLGASLSYSAQKMQASGAYSQSESDRQLSLSMNGAVVAHRYGLTLSQPVSDTFAIAHIQTDDRMKSHKKWGEGYDRWGNAIYSNLSPYESNQINFNPTTLPLNVHLDALEHELNPRRFSTPLIVFKANRRENIVLILESDSNLDIPLGATLETEDGTNFGLAGQSNQIFLENRALLKQGTRLHWGKKADQQCQLENIQDDSAPSSSTHLKVIGARCQS